MHSRIGTLLIMGPIVVWHKRYYRMVSDPVGVFASSEPGEGAVYISPSIEYSGHPYYAKLRKIKGKYFQMVLQVTSPANAPFRKTSWHFRRGVPQRSSNGSQFFKQRTGMGCEMPT